MLEKLNYKFLSLFLISITSVNFLFFTYRFFDRQNGYILGDWLINYEGGFTRRGLAGHLFIKINEIFNLSLTTISYIFLLIIFVILFIFFIKLIKNSKLNFLILLLIYSPANFLFTFFDPLATGRKEILFYLFFCLYLFYREKKIFIYL